MKITNEHLLIAQEKETRRAGNQSGSDDFASFLAKQLDANTTHGMESISELPMAPLSATAAVAPLSVPSGADSANAVNQAVAMNSMEGMFDTFEKYASKLTQNGQGDLREAYSLLQSMTSQISEFKANFPNASAEQPELAAMLNELDVMATTETFKFNRGDYL